MSLNEKPLSEKFLNSKYAAIASLRSAHSFIPIHEKASKNRGSRLSLILDITSFAEWIWKKRNCIICHIILYTGIYNTYTSIYINIYSCILYYTSIYFTIWVCICEHMWCLQTWTNLQKTQAYHETFLKYFHIRYNIICDNIIYTIIYNT